MQRLGVGTHLGHDDAACFRLGSHNFGDGEDRGRLERLRNRMAEHHLADAKRGRQVVIAH